MLKDTQKLTILADWVAAREWRCSLTRIVARLRIMFPDTTPVPCGRRPCEWALASGDETVQTVGMEIMERKRKDPAAEPSPNNANGSTVQVKRSKTEAPGSDMSCRYSSPELTERMRTSWLWVWRVWIKHGCSYVRMCVRECWRCIPPPPKHTHRNKQELMDGKSLLMSVCQPSRRK